MDQPRIDAPPNDHPTPLVVLGASAGGIEALLAVVGSLPADFPAPVVAAQHLDPRHKSHLADLLGSRSDLPVHMVSDRARLQPGTVYVVPANRDVEITDHDIIVGPSGEGRSHPSIDHLMATAAQIYRDQLIGVILTGSGTDGAAGAQAIKGYGGTVIVQNPESARFSGMPSAVPGAAIDVVAELDAIGGLLVELCRGTILTTAGDGDELRTFLERIREQTGLDFAAYRRPTIERRLQRRMVAVRAQTVRDYHRYTDRHPEELQRLIASFLIKVTRFFRDADLFDHLREHVLPHLIEESRERGELRIWSAGCATGEEAYSIAMMICDLLQDAKAAVPVRIFATDISREAIEFARRGIYPDAALEGLPAEIIGRHFLRVDGGYEVRKPVRKLVIFGEHDLSRRAPFPRIDLVLCRNVLIYFTPVLQRRALQLFAFSLRQGGYLSLGKAESVSPLPEYFALEQSSIRLFRRVGGDAPVPVGRLLDPVAARHPGVVPPRDRTHDHTLEPQPAERPHMLPPQTMQILDTVTTGIITVEANYHIRAINIAARTLLGLHATAIGEDLVHQVPPELSMALRTAIDTAFRGERVTTSQRLKRDVVENGDRDFEITSSPVPYPSDNAQIDLVTIEIIDISDMAMDRRTLTRERDELRERTSVAITEIRKLRAADQAMAIEHGRLRAENEQLQLASEEAQSAAEEIETLNEEQQAANEELETLNEELQATVEELNTTNADLQARTIELEALAVTREQHRREAERARARLSAILANMGDAVLVLSASGETMITNPAWDRLLGPPEELAPQDDRGRPLPASIWSLRRAANGAPFTFEFTLPADGGTLRFFEANARPIPLDDEGGGIVVVRDTTDRSLRLLQERFLAMISHELRTPLTTIGGSLQLLSRRIEQEAGDAQLKRLATRAREQVTRLEHVVGELVDAARLQGEPLPMELVPVDLRDITREAVDTAADLTGDITLQLDMPENAVMVSGDAQRLNQVVLNLLVNAIQHATDTGRVNIRVRAEDTTGIIEVQDYGPGIAADQRERIFDQFHQLNGDSHGVGLGLFIARAVLAAHGGTIGIDSTMDEGTTFAVRLPLMTTAATTGERT